jgi:radical SAM protein with 4Fe4S-binding SPASM domain
MEDTMLQLNPRMDVAPVAPTISLREIDINVTNLCNLQCIYCSYASTPNRNEPALLPERIHAILDQAAAIGNKVVHFSGGEPAIRPDMPEFIAHAGELGFKMRMHSNGMLLTRPKLEQLWAAGLRQVLISLDGFAENHNFHRQNPRLYPMTMRGIETAVSLGYNVRVNSVATLRNVDELPKLLPMLAELGVATFSVFYCIPVGRGRDVRELMVPPLRWRQFVNEMQAMSDLHRPEHMEVTVEKVFLWENEWESELTEAGRGGSCLGFLDTCNYVNILADGRVYPCVCFIDEGPPLGNIHQRSLGEILHDPAGWAFYWSMRPLNATCAACQQAGRCRGGSRALSKVFSQDWFALDPRCSGEPRAQGFIPLCFMLRENVTSGSRSGFAEKVAPS